MIISDQAEEVVLMDYDPESESRRQRARGQAYEDDEDHQGRHGMGGPGVQCATQ